MLENDKAPIESVEAADSAKMQQHTVQAEFIERGLRSRDEARRTGAYVDAEVVLDGLQRRLSAARARLATPGKLW